MSWEQTAAVKLDSKPAQQVNIYAWQCKLRQLYVVSEIMGPEEESVIITFLDHWNPQLSNTDYYTKYPYAQR